MERQKQSDERYGKAGEDCKLREITGEQLKARIMWCLYRNCFQTVVLIDARQGKIVLRAESGQTDFSWLENGEEYDSVWEREMFHCMPAEERKSFERSIRLKSVLKELEDKQIYAVTAHQYAKNGEKQLKKYVFSYFQKECGLLLAATQDITETSRQDALTGGYSRQGFIDRARQTLDRTDARISYAILYYNVKNFKAVNELFGMENGNEILHDIYNMLAGAALQPYLIGRLEADHFVCLLDRKNLNYEKLAEICQKKISKNGKTMQLFGRCGIYLVEDRAQNIGIMINKARLAVQFVTDEYVRPWRVYEDVLSDAYIDDAELAGQLEDAIREEQLVVYYQPIVDAATEKIVSVEALIRWNHPQKGFLMPGFFIPALEKNGQISRLSAFVMAQVYKVQESLKKDGMRTVPISVNLSWMDFYDEEMIKKILGAAKESKTMGNTMRLELTETSYAAIGQNHSRTLENIRSCGVKILLDDFGSGYSSFSMMREYDFDILKLDIGFVCQIETNPKSRCILHFLIEMAHAMGSQVVAEGAETAAQVKFLKDNGCDYIQGFHFFRPMPEEELKKQLAAAG